MTTLAVFGVLDWGVLAVYLLAMLAIGYGVARKQSDEADFFLGSRSMPAWAVAISVLATALSAATFIGAPQEAFTGNLSYLILNLGGIFGALIVAGLFIPAFYRAGTLTIYGYLGKRISPASATAASIAFLGGRLLASGARLFMAGIAFSFLLFGETNTQAITGAIIVLGIVGTLYTAMGGIRAVIWTDVAQIVIVVGAAIASIVLLLKAIPLPISEIVHELRHFPKSDGGTVDKLTLVDWNWSWSNAYTVWGAIAFTAFNVAAYGCDHDLAQRLLTTRSAWRSSGSIIGAILLGIPVTLLFMCIGLLLAIFYGQPDLLETTENVYPKFLIEHLPTGLSGLAMAGLLAAALSSFDSAINAMAATWMADVRGKDQSTERGSRLAVIVMGGLLTLFGIGMMAMYDPEHQSLLTFALTVMTFAYTGLLGVFLTALLSPGRGSTASVIAALIAGALVILIAQPYTQTFIADVLVLLIAQPYMGTRLGTEPIATAMPWTMLAGTLVSFGVCYLGKTKR